jgi:hypothetical protein
MIQSRARGHSTTVLSVVAAGVALAGCSLPSGEQLLDGSEVAGRVQRELQIPLTKVEPVESTAVLANVRDVYTGRSSHETVLIVDFNSAAATVQITSGRAAALSEIPHVTRDNIVILYRHEPGTNSRLRKLRAALGHVGPPA